MKNKCLIFICCFLICLLLAGCGSDGAENGKSNVNDDSTAEKVSVEDEQLKNPVLEWWRVYNPNGFNTVTGVMSNPNKTPIDVTYDLVYYKNGVEVHRNEDYAAFNISNEHNYVIWSNSDIPKAEDVDEVKMENITVSKAYYNPISAKYKYAETVGNLAYFDFELEKKPTLCDVTFLLYNDNNKNGKLDAEELVVSSVTSTTKQKDKLYFDTTAYHYTNYEVYYNAY